MIGHYKILVFRMLFLLAFVWSRDLISFVIMPLTAYASYPFLFLLFNASIYKNIISFGSFSLEIAEACAALEAYILLGMLLLLTKDIGLKNGVKMFFAGSLLILGANILRIILIAFILNNFSVNLFSAIHFYLWNFVSGIYVALVWIFLAYRFKVRNIPVYDDLIFLWKNSVFSKRH